MTVLGPIPKEIHLVKVGSAVEPTDVPLFQPLTIRSVTFNNRIFVSPMCQYSAVDGHWNNWHLVHVGQLATRGAGLIILEATGVVPEGRISPNCTGLWKDEHQHELAEIAEYVHSQGSLLGVQLAHAGRKASCYSPFSPYSRRGWNTVAAKEHGGWPDAIIGPSSIQHWDEAGTPKEATKEDIARVVKAFGDAARRAHLAGIDVIEIHGAHGYLINNFLSPLSNQRTDEYGGSFENRIRLLLEVVRAVRANWPENKPVFLRLSCVDWVEGGWTEDETVRLAPILFDLGVDLLDTSSGGNHPAQKLPYHVDAWNAPFSERVRKAVPGLLTGPTGKITGANQSNDIIASGRADVVFLAREFLRNPNFVLNAAKELNVKVHWPPQ
ncbi:uncharacterized protein BJ171DRAFT_419880 [Polychytrium aggregatum]|uniref:uncharacterized protein n=1 Tax=Polychytrium aggregatum TaxID=110093 RepID=UPI0022FE56D8|nr:uncharacterized protein BJ171DRAFT_427233 [Polychytrium aggregatum]XP_052970466.1 uncharacterized protein BJ171DRAFT_419880 [Polychytrium aggregatum]KAI9199769.1 hypothetical protein BJ171DRAFT_427233 [Polychytrium aggregatum]KAI9208386.1 hypothetical protein BJ171DRAFT_419880 [Polychytrium aggregatum]